jgi:hypothetical protein
MDEKKQSIYIYHQNGEYKVCIYKEEIMATDVIECLCVLFSSFFVFGNQYSNENGGMYII